MWSEDACHSLALSMAIEMFFLDIVPQGSGPDLPSIPGLKQTDLRTLKFTMFP